MSSDGDSFLYSLIFSLKKGFVSCVATMAIVLFFSACKKQTKSIIFDNHQLEETKLVQAKYIDIPLPMGYVLFSPQPSKYSPYFSGAYSFFGEKALDELLVFYRKNLEFYGWKFSEYSWEDLIVFKCKKLSKSAVIVLKKIVEKNDKDKSMIYFLVKNRGDKNENSEVNNIKYDVDRINSKVLPIL